LEAQNKYGKTLDNWYNYTAGWVYVLLEKGKQPKDIQTTLTKIEQNTLRHLQTPTPNEK
jgi:hypothetical protein